MKSIRKIIPLCLLLPVAAVAGSLANQSATSDASVIPLVPTSSTSAALQSAEPTAAVTCCWVYWNGAWYCVPC